MSQNQPIFWEQNTQKEVLCNTASLNDGRRKTWPKNVLDLPKKHNNFVQGTQK